MTRFFFILFFTPLSIFGIFAQKQDTIFVKKSTNKQESAFKPHFYGEATVGLSIIDPYLFGHNVQLLGAYQWYKHFGIGLSCANQGVWDGELYSFTDVSSNFIINYKRNALAFQFGFIPKVNLNDDEYRNPRVHFFKTNMSLALSWSFYFRNNFYVNVGGNFIAVTIIGDYTNKRNFPVTTIKNNSELRKGLLFNTSIGYRFRYKS